MKTINNPLTRVGKVKCIHYYELCLYRWYVYFIAIFINDNKIYLYKVEDPKLLIETLVDFGEVCPENMSKALEQFKILIR